MALRLVRLHYPDDLHDEVMRQLDEQRPQLQERWTTRMDGQTVMHVVVLGEQEEPLLDAIEGLFSQHETARAIILPLEGTVPRLESEEEESARGKSKGRAKRRNPIAPVVGHEELFEEVKESIQGGALFLLLVALATVIAAIGMLREDLVILVGAMVMAPLLGPNVAAALAATLGDRELAWTAAKKGASSILVVLAVALVIGLSVDVDPENEQLSQRTEVQVSDVGLALVAGMAGTLAFTTLVPTAVMGVLVAVALLPPLVAAGLLLGAGFWDDSSGALLLVAVYVVGINLAGLLMFLLQGVRPERNKEQPETRRQTWIMMAVWALLLVIFGTLVAVAGVAGELLP